ncbi:TIGR03086 family metal-binding protein [Saccharopolyspora sp. ID03-671]|uniref:TIGR03086 family metal-binding protein n=1 Tax=Saccharopolyspora sp. ID03-671 TaxID=3073066 RepID=UPI00324F9F2E
MDLETQRKDYFRALEWVGSLMSTTAQNQLDLPTPCADYSVRDLIGHLVGTAHRSTGTAQHLSTRHIPHVVTDVADEELAATFISITHDIQKLWRPFTSDERVTAPWGPCTALEALRGFTVETITHGWDLAVATGQPHEAPNQIADHCLLFASAVIPDRLRGVMYGKPVTDGNGDSPTTRLAHLLGHR